MKSERNPVCLRWNRMPSYRRQLRKKVVDETFADFNLIELDGKTLLQYAHTPHFDYLARNGRNGLLKTVPDGFHPGSEVANSSILGYDQHLVYEGRGPLEAASIGVELAPDDLAMRCNLVCLEGDLLKNHSCWSSREATSTSCAHRPMTFPANPGASICPRQLMRLPRTLPGSYCT